jgi:hypothetical protein
MGTFAAGDAAGAGWVAGQVQPAGHLGDLRAVAGAAIRGDRRTPGVFGQGEQRVADVGVDRQPDRKLQLAGTQPGQERLGCAGAVGADQQAASGWGG